MTLALLLLAFGQAAPSPAVLDFVPGAKYDPKIPTLQQVVGHAPGQEITSPEEIATYLKALAAASPDRTRLVQYATTWEGRPLHVLIVGSAQRLAKLDQIKADLRRLADPRSLPSADADRLARELPVVTWLVHAVHGNEIGRREAVRARQVDSAGA
jgi:hypothetical protein